MSKGRLIPFLARSQELSIYLKVASRMATQVSLVVKNLPASAGHLKKLRFDPWVGKIPWRRAWQPTPVFLTGESLGQRSLVGYRPWGHKELDVTEVTEHACTAV